MSDESPDLRKVVIHPGEHYATAEPVLISTVLGSCVAACIYDPVAHVGGMNHFLLANRRYARNIPLTVTEAGRYGVHAMELLINDLLRLGGSRSRLRAKVFGAGSVIDSIRTDNFFCVGEVNKRFIVEFLAAESIPVEASDLGGNQGRIVRFRTDSFTAYRKYIVASSTERLEDKEHRFWRQLVETQDTSTGTVVLFDR